jgi:protein-L-isoaspartate(D-aspartate) O-methyltransferase
MSNIESVERSDWSRRARELAENLARVGSIRSAEWKKAVEETPRHHFVAQPGLVPSPDEVSAWLDTVYSDTTIVVQRRSHPSDGAPKSSATALPTSSSTMPSLMVEMLEELQLKDGHRVLEIGTGTGYNAALLSHRLGAENVVSVDIDPCLVKMAEARLADLGYSPVLLARNGQSGASEYGPYDRIIATCAVDEVPLSWIEQLAPEGSMLINLRGDYAGVLCLLTKQSDDEVIGHVVCSGRDFMWLRRSVSNPLRDNEPAATITARNVIRGSTGLDPRKVILETEFHWYLQLQLPGLRTVSEVDVFDPLTRANTPGVLIYSADGSHAQVLCSREDDGRYRVLQGGGNRRLWDTVETAYVEWQRLGRPNAQHFGVVANPTLQFVWLDDDSGWLRWPLPLTGRT